MLQQFKLTLISFCLPLPSPLSRRDEELLSANEGQSLMAKTILLLKNPGFINTTGMDREHFSAFMAKVDCPTLNRRFTEDVLALFIFFRTGSLETYQMFVPGNTEKLKRDTCARLKSVIIIY